MMLLIPSRGDTQTTVHCREQAITLIDAAVSRSAVGLQRHGSFGGGTIDPAYIFEQPGT